MLKNKITTAPAAAQQAQQGATSLALQHAAHAQQASASSAVQHATQVPHADAGLVMQPAAQPPNAQACQAAQHTFFGPPLNYTAQYNAQAPPPPNNNQTNNLLDMPISPITQNYSQGNAFLMSKLDMPYFRGKNDKRSPMEYLDLIQNKAIAFNIDTFEVVKAKMPLALIDDAKFWWEISSQFIFDWSQFQTEFLNEFCSPNFKRNLRRELELRTQHKDEDLTTFIHKIRGYYKMLGEADDHKEIYERIKNQMHPRYRHYLSNKNVHDLRSLLSAAQQVQCELNIDKSYAPPPNAQDSAWRSHSLL